MSGDNDKSSKTLDLVFRLASVASAAVVLAHAVHKFLNNKQSTGQSAVPPAVQRQLDTNVERLKHAKVIAILRLKNREKALERVQELVDMGYGALEITTDSVGYYDGLLDQVAEICGDKCMVGVGTVTTVEQLEIAAAGGAAFALSPVNPTHDGFEHRGFVAECHSRGIVAMPAAYTPQEVYECYAQGAQTVKLFPAQKWTPKQLKDLKAVGDFKHVNICPSGGINHQNAALWLEAGATAVGMGSCLAGRDIKIADSSSAAFQEAVANWESTEKPAAEHLAHDLGLTQ